MNVWDTLSIELQDNILKQAKILQNKDDMLKELIDYEYNGIELLQNEFCRDWKDTMYKWIRIGDVFEMDDTLHKITHISKEKMIYSYWEEEIDSFREIFSIEENGMETNLFLNQYKVCNDIYDITFNENYVRFHTQNYYKEVCDCRFFIYQLSHENIICYECLKTNSQVTKYNQGEELFCSRCIELQRYYNL